MHQALRARHLADDLRSVAARLPDKPALRYAGADTTYAELDTRVTAAAARLAGLGLRRGDRVVLLLRNRPAFPVALYGAWRAGLAAVPLNPGVTPPEVRAAVEHAEAGAVVVDAEDASVVDAAGIDVPVLATDTDGLEQLAADGAGDPGALPDGLSADDLALVQFTAGTTGAPKGVTLAHRHLSVNHDQLAASRQQLAERDVVLGVVPLAHIYGLNVALAYALRRGATVLLEERFDPDGTLDVVARERASVLLGAPPMYAAWLDLADRAGGDLPDLGAVRIAASGAAPLPAHVLSGFADRLGLPIWEGYGLTETAPVLTTTAMGEAPRPGSVGTPLPEVELRLVDEHGNPVTAGDPGELLVRGPNVFDGYWRDEAATRAAFTDDGWLRTGDIAYTDNGWVYLVDRKHDLIIVSGFNVYPHEVEAVLLAHPDVAQAAVVGVPDQRTGEAVRAVVVPVRGTAPAPDDLIAHCRAALARFKAPTSVKIAEELPTHPTGKLVRRKLRDLTG